MATKKKTTAKEQPIVETPAYPQKEIKGIPDKPSIPPPPPEMVFKVKTVKVSDIKTDVTEQSDITIRLQIIEKEIKDVKAFIRNHFGINFRDYEKETRG